ncbi:MAG: alpha-2-macroglobulin family protein, partial [Gammaproteobacteria bacterium]|nr:alpha-2-macroglobulin family protein [Gammaproteobacteria bacterium]
MRRLFAALALLTGLSLTCLAQAFEDAVVAVAASQYQQGIRNRHSEAEAAQASLAKAENYAGQKLWDEAIEQYEAVLASGNGPTSVWLRLYSAWWDKYQKQSNSEYRDRSLQAAYNAYRAAHTSDEQARALFALGDVYTRSDQPKQAIAAFKEGLGLENNPEIAQRYQQLVEANAFRAESVDVESDSANPKVCLSFTEALSKDKRIHYADYLLIKPAIKAEVSARGKQLCVTGVSHGEDYEITVRPGVPSEDGDRTRNGETFTATVSDREPSLGFRGSAYVLPKTGGQQLPLTSVNVNAAKLRLLRINDRNLTEEINDRRIASTLSGYDITAIADKSGEEIWHGELSIDGQRNRETTTAIPVADILTHTQPGIYVITAEPAGEELENYEDRAAQWLLVSDLGLSTLTGSDGLHVFVRSLDSAQPLPGVELRLYARNNGELGKATADETGYARFDPGLLRGQGGREPAALMAYGPGGDFNFLDLTRAAFDLSDRGVEGRKAPGPVDVFLYTERGIYRPGETVQLMALMRDSRGYALPKLPLTLKIIRPDEVEAERMTLNDSLGGGFHHRSVLPGNARTGSWTVRAYTDPEADPVGQTTFQVEDFVPQTLKLELASAAQVLKPDEPITVDVSGRFLYGAPAANLKAEAELVLREDDDPYPRYAGYHFGLVQDSWSAKQFPVDLVGTDAQGKAVIDLRLAEKPDVGRLLKAVLRVSLFEPGGRPVNRSLTLPYRTQPFAIGIRPLFEDAVPNGQDANFDIIAVDPQGQPSTVDGLRYELYREDYEYYWYYQENHWDYKLIINDGDVLQSQSLSVAAGQPAKLSQRGLDWGNYRLEVFDPKTNVASSVRFQVGWFAAPGEKDAPDQLRVSLDKPRYRAGETAQVHVQAPFAGEMLLTVASDRLWNRRAVSLDAEGTTVALPIPADWGPGVYITVTAFRPAGNKQPRGPGRAIGVTWLALDNQDRTLQVDLAAPSELRPRQTFSLPVTISGVGAGQPTYLTLAAVDEGILQLTDFPSPDPLDYFLGKRKLGVDIRDLYGRLIETGGQPGQLRVGGGSDSRNLDGSGVRTTKTVALFSGPVAVDEQGRASIPLELPDFNGELRLMAVAWDGTQLGQANKPLLVRDPLVVQGYLPRFLAPEDRSQLTLNVQNLNAPPGAYRINVQASGAVALEGEEWSFVVADSA